MKLFAKHKVRGYVDNCAWADNEIAQELKRIADTPRTRMYAGRRLFRIMNRSKIRTIMDAAHHPGNFITLA